MNKNQNKKDSVQTKSQKDMIVFLQQFKLRARKLRIYRLCLCVALSICLSFLLAYGYYYLDSSIPSVLRFRANSEESFCLDIPATGELVNVSAQGKSMLPKDRVIIDLSKPLLVKNLAQNDYSLDVKLFGFIPLKQVGMQIIEEQELIPAGIPIGIYMESKGVLVIGISEFQDTTGKKVSPAKNILYTGDYIRKINGEKVDCKESFIRYVEESEGKKLQITVERRGELIDVQIKPKKNTAGAYKVGVWLRDSTQGVGTMTYVDAYGNFGALGHGINDIDTADLMEMCDGTLYKTRIVAIEKGKVGKPGEMTGMIVYSDENILGDITSNGQKGIFGCCNSNALEIVDQNPLPIGLKQEIKKGPAQILCTVEDTPQYYDISIDEIHMDHDNVNRGIELTVTDPKLLNVTGGIIQGMSGAPIIQNGKIIGAVTHVLVNDPTKGYGIFIENMLKEN